MESFEQWLNKQLNDRGWSQSEAARRSGISASMFSQVISGVANPGIDFLDGVARAFGITRREVYARAGRIEPEPSSDTPSAKDLLTYFSTLMPEHQQSVIQHAKALYALERAERPYQSADLDYEA
jgi:transcriptional regulator with XRE-family HTH domain